MRLAAVLEKAPKNTELPVRGESGGGRAVHRGGGPGAAAPLIPLLKSGDEEVKTRVRQLFLEWEAPE